MSCTFQHIVWLLRPSSTLYSLEREGRAEHVDGRSYLTLMICRMVMQIHRSYGYREHFAWKASVFITITFSAANTSEYDMQSVRPRLTSSTDTVFHGEAWGETVGFGVPTRTS